MRARRGEQPTQAYALRRRARPVARRPRCALVIAESRIDRMLVQAALLLKSGVDIRVTEVSDLDLGLSLLLQRAYDVILLDDALPDQAPWVVHRALRGVAPETPIVSYGQYLDGMGSENDGLDTLIEAVRAAVGATPSSVSASWISASAAS